MKINAPKYPGNVHKFLEMSMLKFRPTNAPCLQLKKVKSMKSLSNINDKKKKTQTKIETQIIHQEQQNISEEGLKFLQRCSHQHFIIGNKKQIDLIYVSSNTKKYIDVEHIWSISIKKNINHIALDTKKKYIALASNSQIFIYKFDFIKGISPIPYKTIYIDTNIRFIQFPKQSHLACFFEDKVVIYLVNEEGFRIKCTHPFNFKNKMSIFSVPPAYQNTVNIFFVEEKQDLKNVDLWYIEMNMHLVDVKFQQPVQIYKILSRLLPSLNFINYSKDIFLIRVQQSQILAVKKGYVLDNVNVNMKHLGSILKYMPNQRLLHISNKIVEVYNFHIDTNSKPNKIILNPLDSIKINKPPNSIFFGITQAGNDNYILYYQIDPKFNKRAGEIIYWVTITKPTQIDQKIQQMFPLKEMDKLKSKNSKDLLLERVDMAHKMGLTEKQIYLQLWNRTSRSLEEDYILLLCTKNYETIKFQVQRKLKKSSMKFRQVLKIQQSCNEILHQEVYGMHCYQNNVKQFITSHFLLKKLNLYKQVALSKLENYDGQAANPLYINIQQYNHYQQADINKKILGLISQFCFQNINHIKTIRIAIKIFKFSFRVHYISLLYDIIATTSNQLLKIISEIPQLLPYQHKGVQNLDILYEGVWSPITQEQWKQNLYLDNLRTIDNKEVINKLINTVWFKRNQFSKHNVITKTKKQIIDNYLLIKSDYIFYYFIASIFQIIKNQQKLKQIVQFVQKTYKLPQNIKGRIFLYDQLFRYLSCRNLLPQKIYTFAEFLKLKDYEIFHHIFVQQRNYIGLILKQIKPLYQSVIQKSQQSKSGYSVFNEGLLNYFGSQLSQISDLKYILNRINNEKIEFHQANFEMYGVLVTAMLKKIKVGSENDIPIDQVLVYIESIPLDNCNDVMKDVILIEQIKDLSQMFKSMKINMNLQEIKNKPEDVINKIIIYQINQNNILLENDWNKFLEITYKILATAQLKRQKLYQNNFRQLPFLAYICYLIRQIQKIPFAIKLVEDEHLIEDFSLNYEVIGNIVQFMYKWKFSEQRRYVRNQRYIQQLLKLLPPENQVRRYRQLQVQLAIILSSFQQVQYPIVSEEQIFTVYDLEQYIKSMPAQHLLELDKIRLFQIINEMEKIIESKIELDPQLKMLNPMTPQKSISIRKINQVFLLRLLALKRYRQSLPILKQLLQEEISEVKCNIVYLLIYTQKISNEINIQCLVELIKCLSFYFVQPLKLYQIIENMILSSYSNNDRKKYLKQKVREGKQKFKGYSLNNFLFSPTALDIISNQQHSFDFSVKIEDVDQHLKITREQFKKNIMFSIILKILCCQPYALAKYFYIQKFNINWRSIRSYLSFIIKQQIFNPLITLQFGKRIFIIIIQSIIYRLPIENVITKYYKLDINQSIQPEFTVDNEIDMEKKLYKNVDAFKRKKAQLIKEETLKDKIIQEIKQPSVKPKLDLLGAELKQSDHGSRQASDYPFNDSDNDGGSESFVKDDFRARRKSKQLIEFNQVAEMSKMAKKKQKYTNQPKMTSSLGGNRGNPSFMSNLMTNSARITPFKMQITGNQNLGRSATIQDVQKYQKIPKLEIQQQSSQSHSVSPHKPQTQAKNVKKQKKQLISPMKQSEQRDIKAVKQEPNESQEQNIRKKKISRTHPTDNPRQRFIRDLPSQVEKTDNTPNSKKTQQKIPSQKVIQSPQKQPIKNITPNSKNKGPQNLIEKQPKQLIQSPKEKYLIKPNIASSKEVIQQGLSQYKPIIQSPKKKQPIKINTPSSKGSQQVLAQKQSKPPIQVSIKKQPTKIITPVKANTPRKQQTPFKGTKNQPVIIKERRELSAKEKKQVINLEKKLFNDNKEYLTQLQMMKPIAPNYQCLKSIQQVEMIIQTLQLLYNRQDTVFTKLLTFMSELCKIQPRLSLKQKWIDIYLKAEDLHEKYSLDLPIKNLFPFDGLYFEGTMPDQLFNHIKPQVISVLNEMNVYKIVKVISLAFKNSKFQYQVIFSYLKELIVNQMNNYTSEEDLKQTQMTYQKIGVLVNKIKPQILEQRIQQIFQGSTRSQNRNTLIDIIGDSIRSRKKGLTGELIDQKVKILKSL